MIMLLMLLLSTGMQAQDNLSTQRLYLSGTGCDDMVQWDFYCTDGRNAGKWSKIGVPSCWETQGFGTFQYGIKFYGKEHPEGIAEEKGKYKYAFTLPQSLAGRQILLTFEGVMTDALVTLNGRKAGDAHQGAFYRFSYDVTEMVRLGKKENVLEVEVSKESANARVNLAERRADYWNFGGIFRPVFIITKPAQNINRVAINAGMDGRFQADVFMNRAIQGASVDVEIVDSKGKVAGRHSLKGSSSATTDHLKVDFSVNNPLLWTAETPNLYTAVFTLKDAKGGKLHVERQKFGFRTIEYRDYDGVYINGHKTIFKGVCRHSFRPESGRTLSKRANIEDVTDIKGMNMNAVRLSHYPADPEFLEACDSLGLYVMNELSGWHFGHETLLGQKLVEEFVTRDVNHPSVIFWSSGNEGGFNFDLEPTFKRFDPQQRVVLYPWLNRNGFDTGHYRTYGGTQAIMRQKEIYMPTEFLHGLYDGGHGAGLYDYWKIMMAHPRCAGGFLWDFADQGVVRSDLDGIIDCNGNYGADGIVGPHHEREGSYYTIREVWSPVELTLEEGSFTVRNHYNFINLRDCKFTYQVLQSPPMGGSDMKVLRQGTIPSPNVEPGGEARLPMNLNEGEDAIIKITATDPHGEEIFAWSFHPWRKKASSLTAEKSFSKEETANSLIVKAGGKTYTFSKKNGLLEAVQVGGRTISMGNGPRFVAGRRADRSLDQYYNHSDRDARRKENKYVPFSDDGIFQGLDVKQVDGVPVLTATYKYGILDEVRWSFLANGSVKVEWDYEFGGVVDYMGMAFDYPEQKVRSKKWLGLGPYRVWRNRMQGPQLGCWQNEYNDPVPGESFEYPEFKGYFGDVHWMQITTDEGKIGMEPANPSAFIGVYTPRDGRDKFLYDFPETGISFLDVIPGVPNKNHVVDLNGPTAQPAWSLGKHTNGVTLTFE